MARSVGEPLSRALGQPVIFDYKPGANSIIAVDLMAKSAPDGYTLTTVIAAHSANPSLYAKLPFDVNNDIVPVALSGVAPLILTANNSFPANNSAELVAHVKANPGKYNFGSSGIGAAAHLAMEQFMLTHGLQVMRNLCKCGLAESAKLRHSTASAKSTTPSCFQQWRIIRSQAPQSRFFF
jgi:tripartite-type tricarboxylate transporter receptor subunit TctC